MGSGCSKCIVIPLPWCFIACAIWCGNHKCKSKSVGNAAPALDVANFLDGAGNVTLPDGSQVHFTNDSIGLQCGQVFKLDDLFGETQDSDVSDWTATSNYTTLFRIGNYAVNVNNDAEGFNNFDVDKFFTANINKANFAFSPAIHPRANEAKGDKDASAAAKSACFEFLELEANFFILSIVVLALGYVIYARVKSRSNTKGGVINDKVSTYTNDDM